MAGSAFGSSGFSVSCDFSVRRRRFASGVSALASTGFSGSVFLPRMSSVVAAGTSRGAAGLVSSAAARARLPWAVRAKWFCGSAGLWIAARTNHARSVRARAAYPRRGRSGRPAPAIASPAFEFAGVAVQRRLLDCLPARCGGFFPGKQVGIQSPSRKLVRKSRLMKQSAR